MHANESPNDLGQNVNKRKTYNLHTQIVENHTFDNDGEYNRIRTNKRKKKKEKNYE